MTANALHEEGLCVAGWQLHDKVNQGLPCMGVCGSMITV